MSEKGWKLEKEWMMVEEDMMTKDWLEHMQWMMGEEDMVTKDWLECLLTSYYLFIECTHVDPDVQVRINCK